MFFLRLTIFIIIALGIAVYLLSTKIRSEFINTGGKIIPQFRASRAEFKAFCNNPPTQKAARLLKLKKQLSIALVVAVFVFLLAILSVIFEQA